MTAGVPGTSPALGARLTAFLAGVVWMAGSGGVGATTLLRMDLPELVRRADRVVHARAVGVEVYWDEAVRQIHTDTTFEVLEESKGRGPDRLVITMLGGRIDPLETIVEGTPVFRVGEEAVLFTSPRPDGKKNLVGFSQGALRIVETPEGEKIAVGSVPAGVTILETPGGPPIVARPDTRVPVSALMHQVREMASDGTLGGPKLERTPQPLDTTGPAVKSR